MESGRKEREGFWSSPTPLLGGTERRRGSSGSRIPLGDEEHEIYIKNAVLAGYGKMKPLSWFEYPCAY